MTSDLGRAHDVSPGVQGAILIVGSGRSGTTALYETLSAHPDFAWFSNYTDRWPHLPQLAALSRTRQTMFGSRLGRLRPIPSEGYRVWDRCLPPLGGPLSTGLATAASIECLRQIVHAHVRYQRRTRFINKNTRNTVRMAILEAVFDEPLFIHVLRDPRATTASLLKVEWWPELRVWSHGGVTPREWSQSGKEPVELAAHLWAAEVQQALDDSELIAPERHLLVKYEDLAADPGAELQRILSFCRVGPSPRFSSYLRRVQFDNRNYKFHRDLTHDQIARVEAITRDIAVRCGYEF